MRIIAGKHGGRVLAEFRGRDVRPTSDRVKESLFQILNGRLYGARVLDLFCGSGALGLECLSRGAGEVCFNDISAESLAILKKNLSALRENGTVSRLDYKACLACVGGKFDLIFADPPYRENYAAEILGLVKKYGLLSERGLVIYESEREEVPIEGFETCDIRRYGRTKITFFGEEKP